MAKYQEFARKGWQPKLLYTLVGINIGKQSEIIRQSQRYNPAIPFSMFLEELLLMYTGRNVPNVQSRIAIRMAKRQRQS